MPERKYNYRVQDIKCCLTCRHSAVDTTKYADCDPFYCELLERDDDIVDWNGTCDKYANEK